MPISAALAVAAVRDLAEAREFYGRLFDRPADEEPMPTLLVTHLDDLLISLGERGITTGNVIDGVISRVAQTTDPAGNTITLAELSS